jgi:hypothetical protein
VAEKKGETGIECKCMIASWVQSIISYHPNLLVKCIYFVHLKTIKLCSSVKLSEPNNKVSIEITVYGVIFINTRLRHPCSSLGADLFRANIVNDPRWPCRCPLEDAIHYLLECSLYTNARMQIIYEYYTIYCYLNWNLIIWLW